MNEARSAPLFYWMPWWMKAFTPVFIVSFPFIAWDEVGRYWSSPARFWLAFTGLWLFGLVTMGGSAIYRRRTKQPFWWEAIEPAKARILQAVSAVIGVTAVYYWKGPSTLKLVLFAAGGGFLVAGLVATTTYRRDLERAGLQPQNRFPWEDRANS